MIIPSTMAKQGTDSTVTVLHYLCSAPSVRPRSMAPVKE